MKLFLKSKARYSLLLLALSGALGSAVAQQNDPKTTPAPGSTLPPTTNSKPTLRDTIKPPPSTNPNTRALPNTGNPADTMRTPAPLPPEGRMIRPDSMHLDHPGHRPGTGMRHDSIDRRMMPSEGGTMPPNDLRRDSGMMPNDKKANFPQQGVQLDSLHQPTMTNDGRTMTKAQRDSLDRSMTMDKGKSSSTGTKPKAKTDVKKGSTSPKSAPAPKTAPKTIDKTGVKPVMPDSTQQPVPKSKLDGGN